MKNGFRIFELYGYPVDDWSDEAMDRDEVNVISGGYGDDALPLRRKERIAEIRDVKFYSGKVAPEFDESKTFSDIIKLGVLPPRSELLKKLLQKKPC